MLRMVTALISIPFLASCDVSLANDQLGVLRDQRDRIHVLYVPCADREERILGVEIVRVRGTLGGSDDSVVWGVETELNVGEVDLIVGDDNAGFDETVQLTEPLTGTYTVVIRTNLEDQIPQGVEIESLPRGLVDTGLGDAVSRSTFLEAAAESCG